MLKYATVKYKVEQIRQNSVVGKELAFHAQMNIKFNMLNIVMYELRT